MGPGDVTAVRRAWAAAAKREDAARSLVDPHEAVAAIALLREATKLLVEAMAAEKGEAVTLDAIATDAPPFVAKARVVLTSDDPLAADALDARALFEAREAAAETVAWLRTRVDPRTPEEKRLARAVRVAVIAGVVVAAAWIGVGWIRSRRNIARDKSVLVSSVLVGSPAPAAVANGAMEASFGVHTQREENPWVMIDLRDPVAVAEVRIFNRADGWEDECLPLVLDVSEDRATWTEIETRTKPFSQSDPWSANVGGTRARWIRVRHPGEGYIALSEIEVYEAK